MNPSLFAHREGFKKVIGRPPQRRWLRWTTSQGRSAPRVSHPMPEGALPSLQSRGGVAIVGEMSGHVYRLRGCRHKQRQRLLIKYTIRLVLGGLWSAAKFRTPDIAPF